MIHFLCLFLCVFSLSLQSVEGAVSEAIWQEVSPYLLPNMHPVKAKLDQMFGEKRLTATKEILLSAGFKLPKEGGHHIIAVTHPNIPGYLLKVYTDYQQPECEWEMWIKRIEGAKKIARLIKEMGYSEFFKVPKKWIYPLPEKPEAPEGPGYTPKHFILVAEDMQPLDLRKNHDTWRTKTQKKQLKALFKLTTALGLRDSCRVSNVPWCTDKKIAFVDTEYHGQWPVNYHPLIQYLSKENRTFWRKLIAKGVAP